MTTVRHSDGWEVLLSGVERVVSNQGKFHKSQITVMLDCIHFMIVLYLLPNWVMNELKLALHIEGSYLISKDVNFNGSIILSSDWLWVSPCYHRCWCGLYTHYIQKCGCGHLRSWVHVWQQPDISQFNLWHKLNYSSWASVVHSQY